MAKMRDVKRGTKAVKAVDFRRANAGPVQPGTDPSEDSALVHLGVRVLLPDETLDVYEKAAQAAKKRGVEVWDDENHICNGYKMAFYVLTACVDIDAPAEPFFDSVEQILTDDELGTDNLALLHEKAVRWSDEVTGNDAAVTVVDVMRLVLDDQARKPGDPGPLVRLRHATLVSCLRTMGSLLLSSLMGKSLSGLDSPLPTESSTNGGQPIAKPQSESPPRTTD